METTSARTTRNGNGQSGAQQQLNAQWHVLVSDVEELLHKLGDVKDEEVTKARAKVEKALVAARGEALSGWASVKQYASNAGTYVRQAGVATDRYVHDSPWVAIGIAGGIGALVGALIARRR